MNSHPLGTSDENRPRPKVSVVMPAYNAEKTLASTLADIPKAWVDHLMLVDDASQDGTVRIARELGLEVILHEKNKGYGANQKTCYRHALERGADIVVMIHPDYQYDARMIPALIAPIQIGVCDMMLGNRIRTRQEALQGGMPLYKYLFNRILTLVENLLLGQNLGECHSGMRAYARKVLERIPWERNSDDFVFDSQFIVQAAAFGFRIGDAPVPARYFEEASMIGFRRSLVYGLGTLWTLLRYILHRLSLWRCPLFLPK